MHAWQALLVAFTVFNNIILNMQFISFIVLTSWCLLFFHASSDKNTRVLLLFILNAKQKWSEIYFIVRCDGLKWWCYFFYAYFLLVVASSFSVDYVNMVNSNGSTVTVSHCALRSENYVSNFLLVIRSYHQLFGWFPQLNWHGKNLLIPFRNHFIGQPYGFMDESKNMAQVFIPSVIYKWC